MLASQQTPNTGEEDVNPSFATVWSGSPILLTYSGRISIFIFSMKSTTLHGKRSAGETPKATPGPTRRPSGAVKVLTSIEFLSGGVKVYETPLVSADTVNVPDRDAVAFQFDVPLAQLKPGTYVCQVNIIDDAGGSFSFPRLALRAEPPARPASQPVPATSPARAGILTGSR